MQNDAATLHCQNELCQAPNHQTDKFCQRCGTPLIKRYLWAVGEGIEAYKPGDLWRDRYLLKSHRIFLDTKPGMSPETPYLEIPDWIKHYLRLVPYRLQVPQVYALVPLENGRSATEILLLEQAPIYQVQEESISSQLAPDAVSLEGQLMPELTDVWKQANSMRQLNWLWQIAQLWQPLKSEGVASSLLNPKLLRVEGSLVRLLELQLDQSAPALASLGQLWLNLLSGAQPAIAGFLDALCHSLIQGDVRSSEQLMALLDRGLAEVGRSLSRTLRIATRTDTGPGRQRNEDACYPPSGTTITKPPSAVEALAIVCDGIGGHEGGNIASNLAIQTIQQQIQQLSSQGHLDPITLSSELERATCNANDQISQRNDKENRYGRQRMGTTVVMALARAHQMYIANVGDSRAYWITRTGCHQVTLDDDVAAREVRLGYALYRDALQQASSGSLVQALGMSPSASLHPTVQRFVLDEDSVFLLCSDGLSDYDRVEQCWETEILPILDGKVDVSTAGSRLVEIANTQNGHDNVTVGLIYCQVSYSEPEVTLSPSLAQQITVPPGSTSVPASDETMAVANNPELITTLQTASPSIHPTKPLQSQPAPRRFVPVLLGIILLGLCGGLAYRFKEHLFKFNSSPSPSAIPSPANSSPPVSPAPSSSFSHLEAGSLIRLKSLTTGSTHAQTDSPLLRSGHDKNKSVVGHLPQGSVLQVIDKTTSEKENWLKLKVCSTGVETNSAGEKPASAGKNSAPPKGIQKSSTSNLNPGSRTNKPVQPGNEGWIVDSKIEPLISQTWKPADRSKCPAQTPASKPAKPATPGHPSPQKKHP